MALVRVSEVSGRSGCPAKGLRLAFVGAFFGWVSRNAGPLPGCPQG